MMGASTSTAKRAIVLVIAGLLVVSGSASTVLAQQQIQSENEPNNTVDTAQRIKTDIRVRGAISGTDKDIYAFYAPPNQNITISFTNNDIGAIDVSFERNDTLSESGVSLGTATLVDGQDFTKLGSGETDSRNITFSTNSRGAVVGPGIYYLVIEEGSSDDDQIISDGGTYTFTIHAGRSSGTSAATTNTTTTTVEQPNDSNDIKANATPIEGTQINGTIATQNDTDWYSFQAT
jgi:hypothetical protein